MTGVNIPAGITAFFRSHEPRCESRPRCHRLPKSAYGEFVDEPSHPLYAPLPPFESESWSQCAAGAAMATVASRAVCSSSFILKGCGVKAVSWSVRELNEAVFGRALTKEERNTVESNERTGGRVG